MRTVLLILFLVGLLLGTLAFGGYIWSQLGDVEIGRNGWIALALGTLLSLGLGGGLMALVFYSSRSGHDDQQHRPWNDGTGDQP